MTSTPTLTETGDISAETADADIYVLGGGAVGATVARRLREDGHAVTLIDGSDDPAEGPVGQADPADVEKLSDAGLDDASTVIVATPSDSRNLLLAQLVRARLGVDRVLVLVNEPDRVDVLADAGHDPLCAATTLANALVDEL